MAEKWVYAFDEGDATMKYQLGGKGANLAEMTRLGLPVPPGFTITCQACNAYQATTQWPEGLDEQVRAHLDRLEQSMGKSLGDPGDPLLVSVRSGAAFSMPGMMDTVLNLGSSDASVEGLAAKTGDRRFAMDSYRRFIQMFSKVVLGLEGDLFENAIIKAKESRGVKNDTDLGADDLAALVEVFKTIVSEHGGMEFPTDPFEQLRLSITAVFNSWNNQRARIYRKQYGIPDDLGTAVSVQAMVFGNMGEESGTGVAFTRDAADGAKVRYGDFLTNAQGEDVVAGIRLTRPISELKDVLPEAAAELERAMDTLENHYRDMCDIEFTIEERRLWMLQTRVGKRTAAAALKIAVDMVDEGLISKEEAVGRIEPDQLDQLLHPQFDPDAKVDVLAKGLNASPGAAVGKVVFDADTADEMGKSGEKVILVRWETTPDDLHGMIAAQGILTSHGGKTSHAAVVARGMGKPAVCGAEALKIDLEARQFSVDGTVVKEGDTISIDGTTGRVVLGAVQLMEPKPTDQFNTVLAWADTMRRLGVRTNADTPEDAAKAREFGAEGIGLCRTEHMFLGDRRDIVESMILAINDKDEEGKNAALAMLLDAQRRDFVGIFEAMDGLPVTIRLLDPPLHEFLTPLEELVKDVATAECEGAPASELAEAKRMLAAVKGMHEMNPMMGLRGCRLGIWEPEIYMMQVRAIMEAGCERKKAGGDPKVEIMIPLVAHVRELEILRGEAEGVCREVLDGYGIGLDYKIGTMIELPRAAVTAGDIAKVAEFFSFGTNDLTQMTFGFSRDDIEAKIMPKYLESKILPKNPFETMDVAVKELVDMACKRGREANPSIKLGICGEHGGDPESVTMCHEIGLDYVSCSPYRVPLARLAAAQAAVGESASKSA
jgi:pyruvate,orthophosphate dikinase